MIPQLAAVFVRYNAPELCLVRWWIDNWSDIGLIIAGMTHQGLVLQLKAYSARGWRRISSRSGIAHSVVGGSAWEPTPWRAVQRAAWEVIGRSAPRHSAR